MVAALKSLSDNSSISMLESVDFLFSFKCYFPILGKMGDVGLYDEHVACVRRA